MEKGANKLELEQSARNDLTRDFSLKGLSKWLKHLEKHSLSKLSNTEVFKNLSGLKTATSNIKNHIQSTCKTIDQVVKSIDEKMSQMEKLDKKILESNPQYKHMLEKFSLKSAALKKDVLAEKNKLRNLMKRFRKTGRKVNKPSLRTRDEEDLDEFQFERKLKNRVNLLLEKYMNEEYFPKANKMLMSIARRNLPANDSKKDLDELAKSLKENWNNMKKSAGKKTKRKVSRRRVAKLR